MGQNVTEKLGTPIAYGRTAEIYAWENRQILKLFYDWFDLQAIQYEQRINQAVHASGLPVPAVGRLLRVNERNGLVYQKVDGVPMWEMLKRRPWYVFRYAQAMAKLHVEMHTNTVQIDLPNQYQRLVEKINAAEALETDLRTKALDALERLPQGNRLCHGDFHPNNLMIAGEDVVIIDWIDATLGNPTADLARTEILLQGALESGQVQNPVEKQFVRIFLATYLRHYFSLYPVDKSEYAQWLSINAAARLSENIPELQTWLITQVDRSEQ
jgi:thiamine kinase-like enzyme